MADQDDLAAVVENMDRAELVQEVYALHAELQKANYAVKSKRLNFKSTLHIRACSVGTPPLQTEMHSRASHDRVRTA